VKRVASQLLIALVVTVSIGYGSYVSAGAATSHPSQFCTSVKPGEIASQRLVTLLTSMSHHSVASTKSQLLSELDAIRTTLRSVRMELRSVPNDVQTSFRWDLLAERKARAALEQATTKRQIRTVISAIVGTHPKEVNFTKFIVTQCETNAEASTTPTSIPATIRQPPQRRVHLGSTLPPTPKLRAGLAKNYPSAIPLLNAGLRVFEATDDKGKTVRVTSLHDLESQKTGALIPGDPSGVIVDLYGTVIDGSGHSWQIDLLGSPKFTTSGDVGLTGLCGHGSPAPASQDSPGAIDYPCKEIQIDFAPGTLNPRSATIAQWTTVNSVTTFPVEVNAPTAT
jgi:hypothetical protein